MGLGAAEVRKVWEELVRVGRRNATVLPFRRPGGEPPGVPDVPPVVPMPLSNVLGPGRNRGFRLPQFFGRVNGLRTAFCDAGRGPAVLFIHGLAGDITHWVHVAPEFADRFRVLGLDLPACGESERPRDGLSVRLYADQVRGLLDLLQVERTALVGHSLGGMVATELALRHPERVSRLVLINPAGFQKLPLVMRAAGHVLLRPAILSTVLPPLWKRVLDLVFYQKNEHTRGFVRSVESTYRVDDIHGIAAVIAGLRQEFLDRDFLAALDRLTVPTLLIWGERDLLTPAKALRRAARRLPNVTVHEIADCGHLPIIEFPERTVRLIDQHLSA